MAPSMLSNNGGRKHHLKDQARLDLDGEFEVRERRPELWVMISVAWLFVLIKSAVYTTLTS